MKHKCSQLLVAKSHIRYIEQSWNAACVRVHDDMAAVHEVLSNYTTPTMIDGGGACAGEEGWVGRRKHKRDEISKTLYAVWIILLRLLVFILLPTTHLGTKVDLVGYIFCYSKPPPRDPRWGK
jgi:hypothetical protein